ncbi:MAG: hypothetical protein N4A72_00735 [Bacteroidales bacterium]|jgi:hypothetical protein|nr:hypothetical protein [Bacteroidales bacterium]
MSLELSEKEIEALEDLISRYKKSGGFMSLIKFLNFRSKWLNVNVDPHKVFNTAISFRLVEQDPINKDCSFLTRYGQDFIDYKEFIVSENKRKTNEKNKTRLIKQQLMTILIPSIIALGSFLYSVFSDNSNKSSGSEMTVLKKQLAMDSLNIQVLKDRLDTIKIELNSIDSLENQIAICNSKIQVLKSKLHYHRIKLNNSDSLSSKR